MLALRPRWVLPCWAVHKNNFVSVKRPGGGKKKVRLETFFSIFSKKKNKKFQKWTKLPHQNKYCGHPTGFNFTHPVDRKQLFAYGQPWSLVWLLGFYYPPEVKRGSIGSWEYPCCNTSLLSIYQNYCIIIVQT